MNEFTALGKALNMTQLVGWLNAGERLSCADISRRLHVSRRTANRYIADVETVGVPLVIEEAARPVYRRFRRNETVSSHRDPDVCRFMRVEQRERIAERNTHGHHNQSTT